MLLIHQVSLVKEWKGCGDTYLFFKLYPLHPFRHVSFHAIQVGLIRRRPLSAIHGASSSLQEIAARGLGASCRADGACSSVYSVVHQHEGQELTSPVATGQFLHQLRNITYQAQALTMACCMSQALASVPTCASLHPVKRGDATSCLLRSRIPRRLSLNATSSSSRGVGTKPVCSLRSDEGQRCRTEQSNVEGDSIRSMLTASASVLLNVAICSAAFAEEATQVVEPEIPTWLSYALLCIPLVAYGGFFVLREKVSWGRRGVV